MSCGTGSGAWDRFDESIWAAIYRQNSYVIIKQKNKKFAIHTLIQEFHPELPDKYFPAIFG
jgi:hypothetical protein